MQKDNRQQNRKLSHSICFIPLPLESEEKEVFLQTEVSGKDLKRERRIQSDK
jgi:hypothetical protein